VGLGNPLVADDAFGGAVVRQLREEGRARDADVVDAGTDLLAHIESFARYDEVILVDTVIDPGRAGQVGVVEHDALLQYPDASPGCHDLSPLVAVKLFRALYPDVPTRFTLVALFTDAVRLTTERDMQLPGETPKYRYPSGE
jgi:hydrogenase maturation protease